MTNLLIVSNTPKSPGNTANRHDASGMLAGVVNSAQPSAGRGLTAFGVSFSDADYPFAALLARQIRETDSASTNVAPGAIAIDGATLTGMALMPPLMMKLAMPVPSPSPPPEGEGSFALSTSGLPVRGTQTGGKMDRVLVARTRCASFTLKEQDQAAVNIPGDQTGTLSAMLLQLPMEIRTAIANDVPDASTATGIDVSARKSVLRADATLEMPNTALDKTDVTSIAFEKQIIADVVSHDAVKLAGLALALPQPDPDTVQLIASSSFSAVMPNMLANSSLADIKQTIATPLGNTAWADDFSQKISWVITQKNQIAELHLNPPDLGPLNVVLKISDNQATALFTSPHSAVREAVENAIPKLREILADNGIMLGNTTVSDQSPRDRNAEGFMNQGSGTAEQRGVFDGPSASTRPSPATMQVVSTRRHNGMVDTFA